MIPENVDSDHRFVEWRACWGHNVKIDVLFEVHACQTLLTARNGRDFPSKACRHMGVPGWQQSMLSCLILVLVWISVNLKSPAFPALTKLAKCNELIVLNNIIIASMEIARKESNWKCKHRQLHMELNSVSWVYILSWMHRWRCLPWGSPRSS